MGHGNVNTNRGLDIFRSLDIDETEEEVCARECVVFSLYAANSNAAARYLKLYDATAANVVVGTTVPVATFYLPPTWGADSLAGNQIGIRFSTALTVAATTGIADNDTGAPGANEVSVVIGYK